MNSVGPLWPSVSSPKTPTQPHQHPLSLTSPRRAHASLYGDPEYYLRPRYGHVVGHLLGFAIVLRL